MNTGLLIPEMKSAKCVLGITSKKLYLGETWRTQFCLFHVSSHSVRVLATAGFYVAWNKLLEPSFFGVRADLIYRPHSSIAVVTRLRLGRSEARVPAAVRDFCLPKIVRTGSGVHPARYSVGTDSFLAGGQSSRGVKLTTQQHPVPSSDLTSYGVFMPVLDGLQCPLTACPVSSLLGLVYISRVSGRVKRRVRKSMYNSTSVNNLVEEAVK